MFVYRRQKCASFISLGILVLLVYYIFVYKTEINYSMMHKISSALSKILPKDHLDAVRLEVDGDVNRDYWREILFGVDHQLVSSSNKELSFKVIKKIFHLNDNNHDKFLDEEEIFQMISKNIKSHLTRAVEVNREGFKMLDTKGKGFVRWDDFVTKYLELRRKTTSFIANYLKNFDENMLTKSDREIIKNTQKRWNDSDLNDDNVLSSAEYLGFIHPEVNQVYLDRMCDKIMSNLDRNKDGQLTEEEFVDSRHDHDVEIVTPYPGYINSEGDNDIKKDDEPSRQKEFKEQIDTNGDGIGSRTEVMEYINPKNDINTRKDVRNIIKIIDQDKDGRLSLVELLANYQKVINSKMVNFVAALHEEDL